MLVVGVCLIRDRCGGGRWGGAVGDEYFRLIRPFEKFIWNFMQN